MRRVLVTHVDSGIGSRLVKALYHDPEVGLVLGMGTSPTPSFLDAYQEKVAYQRLDLAKSRHVVSFFRSERFARARLDSVIHLPFVAERRGERIPGNVPSLISETRRLLEACVATRGEIGRFIYLSSAFVYRPEPGNANVVSEEQQLDHEAAGDSEVRAWIDVDLLCQREFNNPRMRVTILRAAAIVADGGVFVQSPPLVRDDSPAGFDPIFSVVCDRDVARALVLALHGEHAGAFNLAGNEVFPRSELVPGGRRLGPLPLPGLLGGALSLLEQALGRGASDFQRYGIVLDTRRAADALGFEPQYRVEVRGRGREHRIETVRCR